jgi:hypothetical protein
MRQASHHSAEVTAVHVYTWMMLQNAVRQQAGCCRYGAASSNVLSGKFFDVDAVACCKQKLGSMLTRDRVSEDAQHVAPLITCCCLCAVHVHCRRSVRSLRVLRSFRVLRVMKMFKYLDSLKMIAAVRAAFPDQELHCMCLGISVCCNLDDSD